jgi:transcriptional regulator with XRE-family HTH domain
MNVGYNIKRIREIKGFSQKAVADSLGMSETGYGNIERGETEVKEKRLQQIADVLGVSTDTILNFNPDVYINSVSNNHNGVFVNHGTVNQSEKELYQKIIEQKDNEINYLRELLKKKM